MTETEITEQECDRRIAVYAREMINSDRVRRRELTDRALSVGLPATLGLLAEALAGWLGDGRRGEGAAEALVGLSPCVVPTLACAVLRGRPARRVVGAAGVLARPGTLDPGSGEAVVRSWTSGRPEPVPRRWLRPWPPRPPLSPGQRTTEPEPQFWRDVSGLVGTPCPGPGAVTCRWDTGFAGRW